MRRQQVIASAVAAVIINFTAITLAFSFNIQRTIRPLKLQLNDMGKVDGDGIPNNNAPWTWMFVSNRKEFISKVIAATSSAAPILFFTPHASAINNEPTTRIELTVDTEYLIRVLEYFDGDMRKVLGVLVRAPQTTVEIEPPAKGNDPNLSPKDAILRALYSYKSPEDYVTQASWLKVDEPNKGWVEFLTKKRYKLYLPAIGPEDKKENNGVLEVIIQSKNLSLSNLEAAVGVVALSYPLAYSYYNYESFIEEKEKASKKAQLAAKNAAKGEAARKDKKNAKSDNTVKSSGKGENRSSDGVGEAMPNELAAEEEQRQQQQRQSNSMTTSSNTLENNQLQAKVAQGFDSTVEQQWIQSETFRINEMEQLLTAVATEDQFRDVIDYADVAEQLQIQTSAELADQVINELEQLVAAAAAQSASNGGSSDITMQQTANVDEYYVDVDPSDAGSVGNLPPRPNNNTGANSLRSLVETLKPRRGGSLSNNYLDSL